MQRVFHNTVPSEGGNEACLFVPRQVYVSYALPFFWPFFGPKPSPLKWLVVEKVLGNIAP